MNLLFLSVWQQEVWQMTKILNHAVMSSQT